MGKKPPRIRPKAPPPPLEGASHHYTVQPVQYVPLTKRRWRGDGYLVAAIVIVPLLCVGGYILLDRSPTMQRAHEETAARSEASRIARRAVLDCLKYPHDAAFVGTPRFRQLPSAPSEHLVVGLVKAKNGFGRPLTHEYRVLIKSGRVVTVKIGDDFVYVGE